MKNTKKKSTARNVSASPAPVQPVTPTPFVGDKRITRLQLRRDALLHQLYGAASTASETGLRIHMEEFEDVVAELARLKARRNAEPITPYAVTLDEHASRLVRSIIQDDPGFTIEDVVNGCVYFNADDDHDGSPDCFEAARAARLGKGVA